MYKLVITELAQSDLDDIVSYIAVNLSTAAGDFLDKAEKCYSHLRKK